jgi:hypothetical protein
MLKLALLVMLFCTGCNIRLHESSWGTSQARDMVDVDVTPNPRYK